MPKTFCNMILSQEEGVRFSQIFSQEEGVRRRVGSISLAGITGPEELELLEEEAHCESEVSFYSVFLFAFILTHTLIHSQIMFEEDAHSESEVSFFLSFA